ncbi:unnamed protein product [Echinostoma caproni]|uniref:Uncharacterized protein n=1 Tax=Echinostoma caproni TaxID=27848 RepID=A0A183AXS5_9TREM|nr:unnamed protein product [Echinostoma caproni]
MSQSTDQPPPAYSEFDKYPLATDEDEQQPVIKTAPQPVIWSSSHPQTTAAPDFASSTQAGTNTTSVSRPNTWLEPFPKPPGEPPPVPTNWFYSRLSSIRQSLVARFGSTRARHNTDTVVTPSAAQSASPRTARSPVDVTCETNGQPVSLTGSTQYSVAEATGITNQSPAQSSSPSNSDSVQPYRSRGYVTNQSSVETNPSLDHVIILTRPRMQQKSQQ